MTMKKTMKRVITDIRTAAVMLMATAFFAACSGDDIIDNQSAGSAPRTFTLNVSATKGGNATNAGQKALALDGKTLNATWAKGEEVTVFNETKEVHLDGTLTAQSSGSSTMLSGSLTGTIENGDVLTLRFRNANYASQGGTLEYIAANCDNAVATVTVTDASTSTVTTTSAEFINKQAIVKFTLKDSKGNPLNATKLVVSAGSDKLLGNNYLFVKSGDKVFASGYTIDYDPDPSPSNESAASAFDGDDETTWWGSKPPTYVDFHTPEPMLVSGYRILGRWYDTANGSPGKPKDWTLQAKLNSEDEWTTIDTKTDNDEIPAYTGSYHDFSVDVPGTYQYFRLNIINARNTLWSELADIQLFGVETEEYFVSTYSPVTVTPASASNELTVALCNESDAPDDITLIAYVGGQKYYCSKSGVTFENGQYYDINVTMDYLMAAQATEDDRGSLICTAGHVHSSDDSSCPAERVALISYIGTECRCTHGLAVALEDVNSAIELTDAYYYEHDYAAEMAPAVVGGVWHLPNYADAFGPGLGAVKEGAYFNYKTLYDWFCNNGLEDKFFDKDGCYWTSDGWSHLGAEYYTCIIDFGAVSGGGDLYTAQRSNVQAGNKLYRARLVLAF